MRIIDELTGAELTAPDLTAGGLHEAVWAPPAAYEAAAAAGLPALPDDAYERVQVYHAWTPGELQAMQQTDRLTALELAVAEMGVQVYGGVAHG